MNEKQIEKLMKSLGITREEAIEVIREDEEVDKGFDPHPLTKEQEKASKKARGTGEKAKTAKKAPVKRERKPDAVKREILETVAQNLDRSCFEDDALMVKDVVIANPEKEITFRVGSDEYSITLTKHRAKKA